MNQVQFSQSIALLYNDLHNDSAYRSIQLKEVDESTKYLSITTHPIAIRLPRNSNNYNSNDPATPKQLNKTEAQIELSILVSFSLSYSCPVLNFRTYRIIETIDDETGLLVESKKLSFNQELLYSILMKNNKSVPPLPKKDDRFNESTSELIKIEEILDTELNDGGDDSSSFNNIMSSVTINDLVIGDQIFGTYYYIHPCQTTEFVKEISGNCESCSEMVKTWWEFYSRPLVK